MRLPWPLRRPSRHPLSLVLRVQDSEVARIAGEEPEEVVEAVVVVGAGSGEAGEDAEPRDRRDPRTDDQLSSLRIRRSYSLSLDSGNGRALEYR